MKKELYIHIGAHKTGTTALQFFLSDNYSLLLQKNLLYPQCFRSNDNITDTRFDAYRKGHHHLGWHFMQNKKVFKKNFSFSDALRREMDATHTSRVVLSSEVFEEEPEQLDQKWKAIANAFSDFDIKIIFYIRRQDEFIVSAYSTILVNHPTFKGTVADLARKYLNGEKLVPINASIDYFDKLQTLSKFVGKPNIVVKVMEKEQMPGGLFADFLGIFQLPLTNDLVIPDRGKSNQSYTEEMLDVLRILKNVYGHEKFEQFVARLPRNSLGKPNMLNYRKRKEILEQYKESNAKLAKEYLNRSNGELFLGKLNKEETNRTFFEGITKRKLARILGDLALQQK